MVPTPLKALEDKHKEAIKRVFGKEISNGKNITIEEAQKRCCTTAVLSPLAVSKKRVKQVVNYVNYLAAKSPSKTPKNLPEASTSKVDSWLGDFDDPSTRSTGRRELWDERDCKLLEKKFKNHDTLPSTVIIRNMCQNDNDLFEIVEREGWSRLYTKIKNMFKKFQKQKRL